MNEPLIIVDILSYVSSKMIVGELKFNFQPGRHIQIVTNLIETGNSIYNKGSAYPLIGCFMPFNERRGGDMQNYCEATFPYITISNPAVHTDTVLQRYESDKNFKTVLYPAYYEFLNQLALHPNVVANDPDSFEHTKYDDPGTQPIKAGTTDYIDSIVIQNLKVIFSQTQIC